MIFSDQFGRRNITVIGSIATMICLCLAGGVGSITPATLASSHTMVAFLTLFLCCLGMSIGPVCYIVGAEVGTGALREKTIALGTAMNVVSSFVVVCKFYLSSIHKISSTDNFISVTFPYLTTSAGLGSKTAYVYAGFSLITAVWAFFSLPELKVIFMSELWRYSLAN